jgi:hypothetical protein
VTGAATRSAAFPALLRSMPRIAPVSAGGTALALLSLLHLSAALPAPHPSRRPGQITTSFAVRSCLGTQALHLPASARLRGGDGEDGGEAPAGEGGKESQAEGGAPGQEGARAEEVGSAAAEDAEAGEAETAGDEVGEEGAEQAGDLQVRRAAFGIVTGSRSKVHRPRPRPASHAPQPARSPASQQPRPHYA